MAPHVPLSLAAVAAFLLSWPMDAMAQSKCAPRDDALALLAQKYGETPVAIGVTNKGDLVELLTTADGTTWTIIVTSHHGISCMVAAGEGWRNVPQVDPRT